MYKIIILFVLSIGLFNAKADFSLNPEFLVLEKALNDIKTVKGTTIQEVDGKNIRANFFIKLPSKIKIDYVTREIPITVIIANGIMTYYDKKLDQKSQVPAPKMAVMLGLRGQLSLLAKDVKILNFSANSIETIVEMKFEEMPGASFKAFFKKIDGLVLYKIEAKTEGQILTTFFENMEINAEIKENVFQIPNKKLDAKFNF